MKKHKNITRMDYKRTHGWWVRFERLGRLISKTFSDGCYGGKRKALVAAIEYRDEVFKTLPPRHHGPDVLPGPGRIWRERRSYVSLSGKRMYYNAWTAWIMLSPQHPASSNFSIDKWGVRRAKSRILVWLDQKRKEQKHNYHKMLGVVLP